MANSFWSRPSCKRIHNIKTLALSTMIRDLYCRQRKWDRNPLCICRSLVHLTRTHRRDLETLWHPKKLCRICQEKLEGRKRGVGGVGREKEGGQRMLEATKRGGGCWYCPRYGKWLCAHTHTHTHTHTIACSPVTVSRAKRRDTRLGP